MKVGYDDLDIDTLHLSNGVFEDFGFQQPIIILNLGPDATMTLNTYADLWPDRLDDVSAAISAERELALRAQSITAGPLESPQTAANHD